MEIFDIEDARHVGQPSSTILKISLNSENLSRFPIEILYYKEQGFNHFLLDYRFSELSLPLPKILERLRENIFKVLHLYDITISVRGLPSCIFEREILRPGLRSHYEDRLFLLDPKDEEPKTYQYGCEFCARKSVCSGIPEAYLNKHDGSIFAPLLDNSALTNHCEDDIERIEDDEVRSLLSEVLKDYQQDPYYLRKRLVFVRSYASDSHEECSKNRFVYYIYNRREDLTQSIELMKHFGDGDLLDRYVSELATSDELVVSGARMQGGELRTSMYFSIDSWSEEARNALASELEIDEIAEGKLRGIGLDYEDGELRSVKVYEHYAKMTIDDIKQFCKGTPIESRKKLNLFLNSCTKPLGQVLLDRRYKHGEAVSKRVDISMQYNHFKLHQLRHIIGASMDFLEEKDPYTLSFEIHPDKPEKINVYYGPKTVPDLTPPEEEEPEQE